MVRWIEAAAEEGQTHSCSFVTAPYSSGKVEDEAHADLFDWVVVAERTEGIQAATQLATTAANGKDIRIGGGVSTVQQFLRAKLIDHLHLAISPTVLGSGEQLFANIDLTKLGYQVTEHVPTEKATHVILSKSS